MKKHIYLLFVVGLCAAFCACSSDTQKETTPKHAETHADTTAIVLRQARHCALLYTNAYEVHKIITLSDDARLKGNFLIFPIDMKLPTGDRKIAVPIDISVRASIDLAKLTINDIQRNAEGGVTIFLPEPEATVTASKIDNKSVKEYVGAFRSSFSDEELVDMARQGRDSIVAHLDKKQIAEDARLSAANTLLPMLHRLGFKAESTNVVFRKDFKTDKIEFYIVNKN